MEINGAIIFMVGSLYMERCYLGHKVIESYGMMVDYVRFYYEKILVLDEINEEAIEKFLDFLMKTPWRIYKRALTHLHVRQGPFVPINS